MTSPPLTPHSPLNPPPLPPFPPLGPFSLPSSRNPTQSAHPSKPVPTSRCVIEVDRGRMTRGGGRCKWVDVQNGRTRKEEQRQEGRAEGKEPTSAEQAVRPWR